MGVLVSIEVRDVKSGGLDAADLSESFGAELLLAELARGCSGGKVEQRRAEPAPVGPEERRDAIWRGERDAVDKDDVAADAQRWVAAGEGDSVLERRAICHQGCGAEDARTVKVLDGAIDSGGEAEVVRIDDESSGHGRGSRSSGDRGGGVGGQ